MDNMNYFEDSFESIADCRKIVLLLFLIKDDKTLFTKIRFNIKDINQISSKFKNILLEQHENS